MKDTSEWEGSLAQVSELSRVKQASMQKGDIGKVSEPAGVRCSPQDVSQNLGGVRKVSAWRWGQQQQQRQTGYVLAG